MKLTIQTSTKSHCGTCNGYLDLVFEDNLRKKRPMILSICWACKRVFIAGQGEVPRCDKQEPDYPTNVVECLAQAESFIGTETTHMFMDDVTVGSEQHRLDWLRKVRTILKDNGIQPENLSGRWHT